MNSSVENVLRNLASRLSKFDTPPGLETTPLNFAAGAVLALLKAHELDFVFGTDSDRPVRVWNEARMICEDIGNGNGLPVEGQWLAGYYFNDGIIRVAVAFEHLVRRETGLVDNGNFREMKDAALKAGFQEHWLKSWNAVHLELNAIRHKIKKYKGPTVEPEAAITALTHLVDAIGWVNEKKRSSSCPS